ncbi:glycoside hydrolase family 61 protein [Tulasnella calospora MUT 4182]|uniref:lytic cellulose monooxygenase (C4-dehydrogenating) n=1 Tax=Tulasnella calospora MUT 4182 TaxID=1051891 RepID=A0A0C3QIX5_9AGAM|nr:glycoside hydrolase family 61 protein [Tulasnella calospora MUT 4182]
MKALLLATLLAQAVLPSLAHYTFPKLFIGSPPTVLADWAAVRKTLNADTGAPLTDPTSPLMRCYETNTAALTATYTINAGNIVGFKSNVPVDHPGHMSIYMAKALPYASSEAAGSGNVWFKVAQWSPTVTAGSWNFPSQGQQSFQFTLPLCLPNGDYLVRIEHIALHAAASYGGAQYYLACGQIKVVNGGNGTPSPLVSIPGLYTGNEPGILTNIYYGTTSYVPPGPPVWTC